MVREYTEDRVLAVANRFLEVREKATKELEAAKVLLDVAGFVVTQEGNMDEPTIFKHKDHVDIHFYDEEEGLYPKAFDKDDMEIEDNPALEKLCKFLEQYLDFTNTIYSMIFLDKDDYSVGSFISNSQLDEAHIEIDVDSYRLTIPLWAKSLDEIDVSYLLRTQKSEENYWEKCKESIKQHDDWEKKDITRRLEELNNAKN